jgi:hypothetical protein
MQFIVCFLLLVAITRAVNLCPTSECAVYALGAAQPWSVITLAGVSVYFFLFIYFCLWKNCFFFFFFPFFAKILFSFLLIFKLIFALI